MFFGCAFGFRWLLLCCVAGGGRIVAGFPIRCGCRNILSRGLDLW